MGGITDALFGTPDEPAEIVDTTPGVFANLRGPVADSLRNLITSGGGQPSGPMVAPIADNEQTMLNRLMGMAGQAPGQGFRQGQQFLQNLLQPGHLDPAQNPALARRIDAASAPVIRQFNEEVMPRLRSEATMSGQRIQEESSSPFDAASARAAGGLADALGQISSRAQGEERSAQQQAAQLLPQQEMAMDSQRFNQVVQNLQAQALPRMIQDMGIERGLQEFQRRMGTLLQALQLGGNVSAAQPVMMPGAEGSPGLIGGLLGGAAEGLGTAFGGNVADKGFGGAMSAALPSMMSMFSDRRIKENVKAVGRTEYGIPMYEYTIAGVPQIGLMADEVQRVYPEAVSEGPRGLLMVHYDRVPGWLQ